MVMKMKIEADLHTHSVASGHAYSTVSELALAAAERGLKMIAITDHGPAIPGGPHLYHFSNLKVLPEYLHGVRLLKGVEANISSNGEIDLPEEILRQLDFVTAGIHTFANYDNTTMEEHTAATIAAMRNPYVMMITHPENAFFPVDIEAIVKAAAEYKVILELNASSFDKFRFGKRGDVEKVLKMCRLAREYGVPLCLNSDAHIHLDVGNIEPLAEIINMAGLKKEDVLNTSVETIERFLAEKKTVG